MQEGSWELVPTKKYRRVTGCKLKRQETTKSKNEEKNNQQNSDKKWGVFEKKN